MIEQYVAIVKEQLGDGATVESIVELMVKQGAAKTTCIRRAVIVHEFFRIYTSEPKRSARDIEEELAVRYGLTREGVIYLRNRSSKRKQKR